MNSYDYQHVIDFVGYPYYFPEYPENERSRMYTLLQVVDYACNLARGIKGAVNLFGIVINIAHLRVLTRKSMRDNSVNIILAFMAISDTCAMIAGAVFEFRPMLVNLYYKDCSKYNGLSYTIGTFFLQLFRRYFQRFSSWLSILMATVRAIIIKYATESRFNGLNSPKFGVIVSLIQLIVCIFFSIPFILSLSFARLDDWIPNSHCENFPVNYSEPQYIAKFLDPNSKELSYTDGLTANFIPCLSYPVLTTILVWELRKAKKKTISRGQDGSRTARATKLIILMTVSFMIAEVPQAIVSFVQPMYSERHGLSVMFQTLQEGMFLLSHLNACSHLFLCLGMSSKYRDTFCETFGFVADPNVVVFRSDLTDLSRGPLNTSTTKKTGNVNSEN